jgi:UPF0271 protein
MARIDLNCDLGEGAGCDDALMALITSASIACGGHAGDEATMRDTVRLALKHGVVVGAHPGFVDREHFGRREINLSPEAIGELVQAQVRALQKVAAEQGAVVRYLKPHGALYNLAARMPLVANAIACAVASLDSRLALYALSGSELLKAGKFHGLTVKGEVFADRTYLHDGTLTPRERPDALIEDEARAVAQVLRMIREGRVRAGDGVEVVVSADTLCLHGDGPHAVAFAKTVRAALRYEAVEVRACV